MKGRHFFWGSFFIVSAIFIVLAGMGNFVNVGVWSLIFTVVLAAIFIESLVKLQFVGLFFSTAFLAIIYAKPLHLESVTPWTVLGAALLLSIGFSLIFKKHKHTFHREEQSIDIEETIGSIEGEKIYHMNRFGSSIKYIKSDDFQYAKLNNQFGSMKVYFDNAIMQKENAVVDVQNSFGDMHLFFPKDWQVEDKTGVSFADVNEHGRSQGDGLHKVTLVGNVSFGDIKISYV